MKKIVRMTFGSHLYGLNTPDSDTDYMGIYLPTLEELMLNNYEPEIKYSTGNNDSRNSKEDVDDVWLSLPKFIHLACKGETQAIDMLHATDVLLGDQCGDIWNDLVENRTMFYTKNLSSYMGYVKHQAAKYGIRGSRIAAIREVIELFTKFKSENSVLFNDSKLKDIWGLLPEGEYCKKIALPKKGTTDQFEAFYEINMKKYAETNKLSYVLERISKALDAYGERALLAEKNEGVDWKAVSHALRAGYQMRAIYTDGDFEYPLAETDYIKQVKAGELDYSTQVAPVLEALVDEVDELAANTDLPQRTDSEYWNRWLVTVYNRYLIDPWGIND